MTFYDDDRDEINVYGLQPGDVIIDGYYNSLIVSACSSPTPQRGITITYVYRTNYGDEIDLRKVDIRN